MELVRRTTETLLQLKPRVDRAKIDAVGRRYACAGMLSKACDRCGNRAVGSSTNEPIIARAAA